MADKEESVVGHAVKAAVAAVVTAGVTAVLVWLVPGVWDWSTKVAAAAWGNLVARSNAPNWLMYSLLLWAAWRALASARSHWRMRDRSHKRFNQLTMLGGVWRWRYISETPAFLRVYCPHCDGALVYSERWTGDAYSDSHKVVTWQCEHCNADRVVQRGDRAYLDARVLREVDRLIRTGEWREHVPPVGGAGSA